MFSFGTNEKKIVSWKNQKNIKKLEKALSHSKTNIVEKTIEALLEIGEPPALKLLEPQLNKNNKETSLRVAQHFQKAGYKPKYSKTRFKMYVLLDDKDAIAGEIEEFSPLLVQMLNELALPSATFAAGILEQAGWKAENSEEKILFLLAMDNISDIDVKENEALDLLKKYAKRQTDVPLKTQAVLHLLTEKEKDVSSFIEEFRNDENAEISEAVSSYLKEKERQKFLKNNKGTWNSFFNSPSNNSNESQATKFIKQGLEYLKHGFYSEAYCLLALADVIYENMMDGYYIRDGLSLGDLQTQRDREIKVWGDFQLHDILSQISEKIRGNREASNFLSLLLSQENKSGEQSFSEKDLKQIIEENKIVAPDLISKTIDYLKTKCTVSVKALQAIQGFPDKRLIKPLIESFQYGDYIFYSIQALIYIDEDAIPELLKTLEHPEENYRTNAAFVLGMIGNENSVENLKKALEKENSEIASVSMHFALCKITEQPDYSDYIFKILDRKFNTDTRKHAARCIRHLSDETLLARLKKYVSDSDEIVRNFAVAALGDIEGQLPETDIDMLLTRLEKEKEEEVINKISEVLGEQKENEYLVQRLKNKLTEKTTPEVKSKIVSLVGNLKLDGIENELLALWKKSNKTLKRSLLWTYGQLGIADSINYLSNTLSTNKELSRIAAIGLIFMSSSHENEAKKVLKSDSYNDDAILALAMMGDKKAVNKIKSKLGKYNSIQDILENLEYAAMAQNIEMEAKLKTLLTYSSSDYYPTDRYVRLGAIQALAKTYMAN